MAWKAWSHAARCRLLEGVIAAALSLLLAADARAAEFTFVPWTEFDESRLVMSHHNYGIIPRNIIRLDGEINSGDLEKILEINREMPEEYVTIDIEERSLYESIIDGEYSYYTRTVITPLVLSLNSDGGSFEEALKIARFIAEGRDEIATLVERDAVCLSACAVIFMFGAEDAGDAGIKRQRYLEAGGVLGFHRPSINIDVQGIVKVLDEPPEVVTKFISEVFTDAYDAASQQLQELLEISPGAWDQDLVLKMLTATGRGDGEEFVYLDKVDDAIRWRVSILNLQNPPRTTDAERRERAYWLCVNMLNQVYRDVLMFSFGDADFTEDPPIYLAGVYKSGKPYDGERGISSLAESMALESDDPSIQSFEVRIVLAVSAYYGCDGKYSVIRDIYSMESRVEGPSPHDVSRAAPEEASFDFGIQGKPVLDAWLYSYSPWERLSEIARTLTKNVASVLGPLSSPRPKARPAIGAPGP